MIYARVCYRVGFLCVLAAPITRDNKSRVRIEQTADREAGFEHREAKEYRCDAQLIRGGRDKGMVICRVGYRHNLYPLTRSNLASNWLGAINGAGPMAIDLRVLSNSPNLADRQDLLTAVSESGAVALWILGLAGLANRRRLLAGQWMLRDACAEIARHSRTVVGQVLNACLRS